MSYPNIPNVTPDIDLSREDVINLLLASIAFEELGLAHIINSEAEKIQYILGTLEGQTPTVPRSIDDLLGINRSVERTLRTVIKNQMLLQFKLEDVLDLLPTRRIFRNTAIAEGFYNDTAITVTATAYHNTVTMETNNNN